MRVRQFRWLRRMMAELGTSEKTLKKLLSQKSGSTGVTAIYDRADRKADVRRALLAWGAKLDLIVSDQVSKVVRIG